MSERRVCHAGIAGRLALRFHFLFEALGLGLLPERLAAAVGSLAAAAEAGRGLPPRGREVGAAFLEAGDGMLLGDLEWPKAGGRAVGPAAQAALARSDGKSEPLAAAERLGRFCEELAGGGGGRRGSGSYYTPGWAARTIAETTLRGVLEGRGRRGAERALSLTVLDPAAGAGAFAAAAVEAIAAAAGEGEGENTARRAAARDCVFGIEMNPLAAEACRLAVWLAASRPGKPAAMPAEHVAVGDALADRPARRSFDVVVGNPPWGVRLEADRARKLASSLPEALRGHRDSYLFFLHLAAESVRAGGGIGMLLPDALLWQVRYQGMRRALLERFRPRRVMLLGDRLFQGATAPACGLCLAGREIAPREYEIEDLRRVRRTQLSDAHGATNWVVEVDAPLTAAHHSFVVPPVWLRKLADRTRVQHATLEDLGDVFEFHDAGINYPRAQVGRKILYYGEREDARDNPVTRGRDFGALTRIGRSAWLRHDWRDRVSAEDGAGVREQVYRRTPKLLIRQTGDRPLATVDRRGVWFGRSVIAIAGRCERDLLWLAAVLNSGAFAALYRSVAPEAGRPFAQVKVSKLKVVPVPWPARDDGLVEAARALLEETEEGRRGELMEEIEHLAARAYGLSARERHLIARSLIARGGVGRSTRGRRGGTW